VPSLNLRNPFRRDNSRPPLRQRAAILKAAAARVIRGEPSPLGTVNPVLVALEAEFQAATVAFTEADDEVGAAYERYIEPTMPDALWPRNDDWVMDTIPRPDTVPITPGRHRVLPYGERHAEELRGRRHVVKVFSRRDPVPCRPAQERGDAIVAAWDSWQASIAAARQAAGLTPLLEARGVAGERQRAALSLLHETPARSLSDFALKARVASAVCDGLPLRPADRALFSDDEEAMPFAITADLLALSGSHTATGA
jgi:hypothetical protein